jgi:hypothetical protein
VLLAATDDAQQIDVNPFINLLYSGSWTDCNKASLLLLRVTEARNPEVLRSLRTEAMGPLVEGGSWATVPGHSTPFLVILGRIGCNSKQEARGVDKERQQRRDHFDGNRSR